MIFFPICQAIVSLAIFPFFFSLQRKEIASIFFVDACQSKCVGGDCSSSLKVPSSFHFLAVNTFSVSRSSYKDLQSRSAAFAATAHFLALNLG